MPEVVEVAFRNGCKVYSFDAAGLEISVGDQVIVRTSRGIEIGKIVVANHEVPQEEIVGTLRKSCARPPRAIWRPWSAMTSWRCVFPRFARKNEEYGIAMRLINTEVVFDGGKIIISFFAEERVDFRKLVEDLAKKFRTRIEFRQVGVRDEARLIGAVTAPVAAACCTMFAGDQQPVSIKMAKEQNLPLNPMKILGNLWPFDVLSEIRAGSLRATSSAGPGKGGCIVQTDRGEGRVVDYLVPKEKVLVNLGEAGQTEASEEIKAAGEKENPRPRDEGSRKPRPGEPGARWHEGGQAARGKRPEKAGEKAAGKPGEKAAAKPGEKTDEKPARRLGGRGGSRGRAP